MGEKIVENGLFQASDAEEQTKKNGVPANSVNLRDLATVSSTIRPGVCFRSSQVISSEDIHRLNVRTVLDLRQAPILCKAHPNNSSQILQHAWFKGRIWFAGVGKCHVRLRPSTLPDHNRALPCQRCTGMSEEVYGIPAVVYHVDLLPLSVSLNILHNLPGRLQFRVIACAARKQAPEPIVAAAIADPAIMGYTNFYKILLKTARRPLARAIRIFSNPGATPVLMHCIHGKDRTGLVAMFLLFICGIPPKAIVEDYVRSDSALRESRDKQELVSIPDHLTTNAVMAASAQVLEDLLAFLDEHYGGPIAYLKKAGITDEEMASIRKTLMLSPGEEAPRPSDVEADVTAVQAQQVPENPERDPDFTTRLSIGQYREEDLPPAALKRLSKSSFPRFSKQSSAPRTPSLHVVEE